ncbi:16S rRNA (guanine(966)-N(2))-methyltransferase RsmD [Demetria terragena]|uniref:16S rRNA (guanine(966)-N(2))-methyltransferase RsmD n=1 Tax=Demetria terragena TaxID=63959 RepID=UPI00035EBDD9|nr:16S rRNA (guanine(966)-N(2))-methyltransferase RsmD [Demetria terragena]
MTRIIAGAAGGRRLRTPPGQGTRPTSDRVREALFARLEHLDVLHEAEVLDLYAGSGALGLEAASRGASSVLFVEADRRAARIVQQNATDLGFSQTQIRVAAVEKALSIPPADPYIDLVFADPPYAIGEHELAAVLEAVSAWLVSDALLVIERGARSPEPTWPTDTSLIGPRRYGETVVWFAEYIPEGSVA